MPSYPWMIVNCYCLVFESNSVFMCPLMIVGTWAMSEGKSTSGNVTLDTAFVGLRELNYNRVNESGTDFESGWEKHRKPLAFIAHKIRFTTSFMPWSGRVPISEGFHEFL